MRAPCEPFGRPVSTDGQQVHERRGNTMNKRTATAAITAAAAAFICAGQASAKAGPTVTKGVFGQTAAAYTYNADFVPANSSVRVQALATAAGATIVVL